MIGLGNLIREELQEKEDTMGLLDQLKETITSKLGGSGSQLNSVLDHAMSLINNPATGGIAGLVETFKSKGLGEVINSWIGTGANKPISPDQLINALGADKIAQIAEKVGISKDAVSQHLSQLLPQLIDKLTPNGKLPEAGKLGEALTAVKKQLLGS
ncbi:MAG TPA: YidB family protein [Nitrospirota bacterium]|nr:YidB family protein [Nitrospirota bacterium]